MKVKAGITITNGPDTYDIIKVEYPNAWVRYNGGQETMVLLKTIEKALEEKSFRVTHGSKKP